MEQMQSLISRLFVYLNLYTLVHLILTWGIFIVCIHANDLYEAYPRESTYHTINSKLFCFILGFYLLGNLLFALKPKLEAKKAPKLAYLLILTVALLTSLVLSALTLRPLIF